MSNKVNNYLIKFSFLVIGLLSYSQSFAQKSIESLLHYFYPLAEEYMYIRTPDSGKVSMGSTYKIETGNILKEAAYGLTKPVTQISETKYKFEVDYENFAIVSTSQIHINPFTGRSVANDKIILFILPEEGKKVEWTEMVNGEKYTCRAEFVYIKYKINGKINYSRAVKIYKSSPLDNGSVVDEWSYWTLDLGRLGSYGTWGNPDKISTVDKLITLDLDYNITEITKERFLEGNK